MAAGQVAELGYKNVMIYKEGVPGWAKAGYPLNREKAVPKVEVPSLNAAQLKEMVGNVYILDVRPEFRYKEGYIKGSHNIPIYQISKRYNEIPTGKNVVVVDGHGVAAWIPACWFLKSKGYKDLTWLQGGKDDWEKGGLPIER